jgi:hypothetical protein
VVLPREVSETLPRRGRTTVAGTINGHDFQATLEPDGQLSHWLQIGDDLMAAAGAAVGKLASFEIAPVAKEPDPEQPDDLRTALAASPGAQAGWDETSTLARLDWIHWVSSAKQAKTRAKRIDEACDKLAAGKLRVCCFDPSGFYSKALSAPEAAD